MITGWRSIPPQPGEICSRRLIHSKTRKSSRDDVRICPESCLMEIVIGSDHAGFDLKNRCISHIEGLAGIAVRDIGVFDKKSADYPEVAHRLAADVADGKFSRGILICGSGIGMSIVANRHKGVRAALCHNLYLARMARMHNDANILVMGERVIGWGLALEMVDVFLETRFEGGRHRRRLDQIDY